MSQRQAKRARRIQQVRPRTSSPISRGMLVRVGAAVVALALVAAVVAGVLVGRHHGAAPVASASASGAVQLSGTDPITGAHIDLASYTGKPVVLNIWASWCPGCNQEAADLARFAAQHPNVQVLGLDTQDTDGDANGFYRRWNWQHPSVRDPSGRIAASLGLHGLPTTYFLNREHRIVASIVGAGNLASFDQGLRQAVGTKAG
jgi:thiol-disulfide isomerase/thioredoxin